METLRGKQRNEIEKEAAEEIKKMRQDEKEYLRQKSVEEIAKKYLKQEKKEIMEEGEEIKTTKNLERQKEDQFNIELLLGRQNELLILYQDLEGILQIPLDLNTVEGQSWIRAMSYRIVQELTEAYSSFDSLEEDGKRKKDGDITGRLMVYSPNTEELIDALFYFLELTILTNFETSLIEWRFLEKIKEDQTFLIEELNDPWETLFWKITAEVGRLNGLLRKRTWREKGEDVVLDLFSNTLRQIWFYLSVCLSRTGLSFREIENLYLEKWEENFRRAKIGKLEKEIELQKITLDTPPTVIVEKEAFENYFIGGNITEKKTENNRKP